jgi:hypothetical protein
MLSTQGRLYCPTSLRKRRGRRCWNLGRKLRPSGICLLMSWKQLTGQRRKVYTRFSTRAGAPVPSYVAHGKPRAAMVQRAGQIAIAKNSIALAKPELGLRSASVRRGGEPPLSTRSSSKSCLEGSFGSPPLFYVFKLTSKGGYDGSCS